MGERKPNPDQQDAIFSERPDILVSASAGTGKTDVLVSRIIHLLEKACSDGSGQLPELDEFLVVTFTRAAAAEMRERIEKQIDLRLSSDTAHAAFWRDQKRKLASAMIGTIDGFCLDVLKSNFTASEELSPGMNIVDGHETAIMRRRILDGIIKGIDRKGAAFVEECISDGGDNDVYTAIYGLYTSLVGRRDGLGLLGKTADELKKAGKDGILSTVWGKDFLARYRKDFAVFADIFSGLLEEAEGIGGAEKYVEFITCLSETASGMSVICDECLNQTSGADDALTSGEILKKRIGKAPSKNSKDTANYGNERRAVLDEIRGEYSELYKKFKSLLTLAAEFRGETLDSYRQLIGTLSDIIVKFDEKYRAEKARHGFLEFSDLQRITYKVLKEHPEIAEATAKKYRAMFLDEYQDASPVQDGIFEILRQAGAERFMVGDAKQCIYAFRDADPSIFNAYRRRSDIQQIYLRTNYRSTEKILDFANRISGAQLSACENTEYVEEEDDLRANDSMERGAEVVCRAISCEGVGGVVTQNAEAVYVANEIKKLASEGTHWDDIAVLLRTKSPSVYFEDAFEKAGIPYENMTLGNLLDAPEVRLAVSLLNVVNNTSNDVHVAAVMRSPLFGFSLDDLVKLDVPFGRYGPGLYERTRLYPGLPGADPALDAKCGEFTARVDGYGRWVHLPVSDLLWNLYTETGMLSVGSARSENTEEKKKKLIAFHDFTVRFESGKYRGLFNFVDYINGMIAAGEAIQDKSETSDCVSIMTSHTSKGLGIDAVFLPNLRGQLYSGNKSNYCFVDSRGFVVSRLLDRDNYSKIETFIRKNASEAGKDKELAEELRLIYVMLTRAKKRLYLCVTDGKDGAIEKAIGNQKAFLGAAKDKKAAAAYLLRRSKSIAELISAVSPELFVFEKYEPLAAVRPENGPARRRFSDEETDEIRRRLESAEKITHDDGLSLPTKLTVTSLSKTMFDDDTEYPGLPVYSAPLAEPEFIKEGDGAAGAARKGTATHEFMQFCDFAKLAADGFDAELERLKAVGFVTHETAALVSKETVSAFLGSRLFDAILSTPADKLYREYRFFVFLPADEFTENDEKKKLLEGREILVQGAIDLVIENPDGTLDVVDYKTDSRFAGESDEALAARLKENHREQLRYYRRAAEEVFRKPVRRTVIYSFSLGGEIAVETAS